MCILQLPNAKGHPDTNVVEGATTGTKSLLENSPNKMSRKMVGGSQTFNQDQRLIAEDPRTRALGADGLEAVPFFSEKVNGLQNSRLFSKKDTS